MKRRELLTAAAAGAVGGLAGSAQGADSPAPMRVALISPNTGVLAAFGITNQYVQRLLAPLLGAGIDTAQLGRRVVQLEMYDAASSSDKAARLAASVVADGVHMVLASGTPEICNPVADVCEAAGVPCVTTVAPWQAWFFGRKGHPEQGFRWTYHFFIGLEDFSDVYASLFRRAALGTSVGGLFGDDIDAGAFLAAFPRALTQRQLNLVDPGRLKLAAPDFAAIASRLRDARVPIVTGVLPPPVALDFFNVAREVGYRPRMASIAKAFPFPDTVAKIGQPDLALTNEVWWSPAWPFRSALTGTTSEQLARDYEQATGRQWIQTLGFSHALVEVAVQTLRTAQALTRPALRDALARLRAQTVVGPLTFGGRFPVPNVCSTPAVGGQWVRDARERWILQVVDNTRSPFIPVTAQLTIPKA